MEGPGGSPNLLEAPGGSWILLEGPGGLWNHFKRPKLTRKNTWFCPACRAQNGLGPSVFEVLQFRYLQAIFKDTWLCIAWGGESGLGACVLGILEFEGPEGNT